MTAAATATATTTRARVDWRIVLGAILLLAVALRVAAIGSHISLDDGYSYLVGSAPSPHAFLEQLARSENTPPLFYLLLAPLPLEEPAWLRLPAALPGAAQDPGRQRRGEHLGEERQDVEPHRAIPAARGVAR